MLYVWYGLLLRVLTTACRQVKDDKYNISDSRMNKLVSLEKRCIDLYFKIKYVYYDFKTVLAKKEY